MKFKDLKTKVEFVKDGKLYPAALQNTDHFKNATGISYNVLVNVLGLNTPLVGRYEHSTNRWKIDNLSYDFEVLEWWHLPEFGTGNK